MIRFLITSLFCIALARSAGAATPDGAGLPSTYHAGDQVLVMNGMAVRTVTMFNVRAYVVALYLPRRNDDANRILAMPGPKVILIRFLHAATKAEVDAQFRDGLQKNCSGGGCSRADGPDFDRLVAATPAFKVGDTFTYVLDGHGIRALVNDRVIGDFANPDLARHLLESFIGADPPSPAIRAGLLGAG